MGKAFTLVELIVVITVLAILGTVAFLSLQGYSLDARDTKRVSDLGNISQTILQKLIKGEKVDYYLGKQTNTLSLHSFGGTNSIIGTDYNVGELNYGTLNIKEEDFLDPFGNKYIYGYTKKFDGSYSLSATLENGNVKIAKVTGNYNPRTSTGTNSIIKSGLGTNIIFLETNNGIRLGDTIITNGIVPSTFIVKALSYNHSLGNRVIINGNIPLDATYIELKQSDSLGLIADENDNTKIILDRGTFLPY